jgi:hypothetical protein
MRRDTGKNLKSLATLLPHMSNVEESRELVDRVLCKDRTQYGILKTMLGFGLKPIFGFPDGYYNLDLSVESARVCLGRLFEISHEKTSIVSQNSPIRPGLLGDTSQV